MSDENRGCCHRLNAWLWRTEEALLDYDHLKPAPCISHQCLAILRASFGLFLLAEAILTLVVFDFSSLKYFSQWSLFLTTVLFGLMAFAQIRNVQHMNEFHVKILEVNHHSSTWLAEDLDLTDLAMGSLETPRT